MTDNFGNYTVTKNFDAVPHFTIASNTASLNGRFDLFGFRNEVTIGTNGFTNGQYSYRNSIATVLGSSNLANPAVLPPKPIPDNGGQYRSAVLSQQTIVTADTFHFNDQWAVQGVVKHVVPEFKKLCEDRRRYQRERRRRRDQSDRQRDLYADVAAHDICHIRQKRRAGRAGAGRHCQRQPDPRALSRSGIRGRRQIRCYAGLSAHPGCISDDAPACRYRSRFEHLCRGRHSAKQRRRILHARQYAA